MESGAAHALDVRDPTRDQRLLEFCWRLPDEVFWGAGEQRALVRRGMRHHLPPEVLGSRHKGLQSADFGARLLAVEGGVMDALKQLADHPVAREWLDVERLRATLLRLRNNTTPQTVAAGAGLLARGLAVGQFLTRF
jgi:asparagine synthase (glutamine-hydrolysing)